MINIRHTTFGLLTAAALAGCSAPQVASAPAPAATGQDGQSAAVSDQQGADHYAIMGATNTPVAYMTATVNNAYAYRAHDNIYSTYWQSGTYNKPVFRATMASPMNLFSLKVMMTPNVGSYTIETSTDAKTWKVALSGVKNTTYYPEFKTLPAGTVGKYVRVTFANNGQNIRLNELDVYTTGTATTSPTPTPAPTATPKPTTTPAPGATPAPTTTGVTADMQKVLDLVNAERAKVGAKPLAFGTALNNCALFRSKDMATRNYFAHTDPDGHDCFYWFKQYGVSYSSAGENIAMGQRTPADVMNSWMNSAGHKANILNTSFGHIGIGIYKNSSGTIYWTQDFTN